MRWKHAIPIALCLGLVLNILGAWVGGVIQYRGPNSSNTAERLRWPAEPFPDWPPAPTEVEVTRQLTVTHWFAQHIELWPDSDAEGLYRIIFADEWGAPFRVFRKRSVSMGPIGKMGYIYPLPWWQQGVRIGQSRYVIPVEPRPVGLILGSVFWGVIVLLAQVAYTAAARTRRQRRGLCIRCGYSVSGLDHCPECGSVAPGRDF